MSHEMVNGFRKKDINFSLSKEVFHLILFPTEECNFRCLYCYEDFEIGMMDNAVVKGVKKLLEKKAPNIKRLVISWFGGEPLLARSIVEEISTHALALSKQYGFSMDGETTTNGFLLDTKTLEKMVALNLSSFQISIDGDKESHDKTRITRNGKGSFDRIWQRLKAAAETDLPFTIILRIHVTDLNQASVEAFCQRYQQHLAQDARFQLFFKAIEDLGGDQHKVDALIGQKTARQAAADFKRRYGPEQGDDSGNYICYAAKPNSFSIRADGRVNKCTVALKDDRNMIGQINEHGDLLIDSEKAGQWLRGFEGLDAWRLGCPLSYMNQHSTAGDITVRQLG